tara:strand:+ start:1067 stop:1234 length:168 start_codon:yes stop_codon:yes gene_type:complete
MMMVMNGIGLGIFVIGEYPDSSSGKAINQMGCVPVPFVTICHSESGVDNRPVMSA